MSAGTTAVNLTGLSAGTSYTYKAYSASGCGDANELTSITFTTGYNLGVSQSSNAVKVSWDAVSGASGYEVQYRASYPGQGWSGQCPSSGEQPAGCYFQATNISGTYYTITEYLHPDITYEVRVRTTGGAWSLLPVRFSVDYTLSPSERAADLEIGLEASRLRTSLNRISGVGVSNMGGLEIPDRLDNNAAPRLGIPLGSCRSVAFRTGEERQDYRLNSVVIKFAERGTGEPTVSIHEAAGTPIRPGSQVGSNLRGSAGVGERTYRASGITLAKDTWYFFSICEGTSRGIRLSAAGDALAGKGGWSAMGRLFSGVPGVEPGHSVSDSIVPKFAVSASGGAANPNVSVSDTIIRLPSPSIGLSRQSNSSSLSFPVSLSPAAREPVRVDYVTRNGTVLAGEDCVSSRGTLTFAPGETSQTVEVVVLPGEQNEDNETMMLEISNPRGGGAVIGDGEGVGTILATGVEVAPVQEQIARLGRTVAEQVLDAVDARMGSTPTPGLAVTLAGQPVTWPDGSDERQPVAEQVVEQLAQWLTVGNVDTGTVALRRLDGSELLASSSFALNTPTASGGLLSFWGGGAVTHFDGREGELSLDGEVTTWLLGADWHWGHWPDGGNARRSTAGLVVSRSSSSSGGYGTGAAGREGEVDSTLTGAFPWARHRFTDRLEVWGTAGYGQGDLKVTPKHPGTERKGATIETDLNLWLAAGGLHGTLLEGGEDSLTLTGKTDALAVGTSSGRGSSAEGNLKAAQARVTRLRLALEAERPIPFPRAESESDAGSRGVLTPSLELGLRYDGGDAETGFGLDLGGGILLSHPEHGLQAEVRGRSLLSHAADGFQDRGFSGSLSWQQQPASDRGTMVSLSQSMGSTASGGADALLSSVTLEGLAASNGNGNDDLSNQRLELQLSYGFPTFGDRFTLTPEVGLGFSESGRDYRIGWNLKRTGEGEALDLSLDLIRRENTSTGGGAPEHGVRFGVNTRF